MNILYRITHSGSNSYYSWLYNLESSGHHLAPKTGGFILAANHASFYDPPALGCRIPRDIYFFARNSLFKGILAWLLPRLNTIPVARDGDSDIGAMKRVFKVLKTGDGILIFPEGTRTTDGNLRTPQKGVGLIACKTGVPVLPARIFGSFESFGKHHKKPIIGPSMHIVYGKPLYPVDYEIGKGKERYELASKKIMEAISQLKKPKQTII